MSAPFYGLLFTQMALQGLPDIVAVRAGPNPRVERELTARASRVVCFTVLGGTARAHSVE